VDADFSAQTEVQAVRSDREEEMKKRYESAAILTIKDAANMTPKGRRQVADWLRRQAKDLLSLGDQYDKTLRARYLYEA
jgi:chromosomal replication initiation ATPase DnaA